jgi:hypothetical protein
VPAEEDLRAILSRAADGYRDGLVEADRYVRERGGRFYNFLQPSLYIEDDRTEHEVWLVRNQFKMTPGFEGVFRIGYPLMVEAMAQAREQGVESFDISDVLRPLPEATEVYFDPSHVNHVANELIARRIYELVWAQPSELSHQAGVSTRK